MTCQTGAQRRIPGRRHSWRCTRPWRCSDSPGCSASGSICRPRSSCSAGPSLPPSRLARRWRCVDSFMAARLAARSQRGAAGGALGRILPGDPGRRRRGRAPGLCDLSRLRASPRSGCFCGAVRDPENGCLQRRRCWDWSLIVPDFQLSNTWSRVCSGVRSPGQRSRCSQCATACSRHGGTQARSRSGKTRVRQSACCQRCCSCRRRHRHAISVSS